MGYQVRVKSATSEWTEWQPVLAIDARISAVLTDKAMSVTIKYNDESEVEYRKG